MRPGVATRASTSGGGEDHLPGFGSELLRRRPPDQASSSSLGGGDWIACLSMAGAWFSGKFVVSREGIDGNRDKRILGLRVRELDRVRKVDGPGLVGGDSVDSVG